MTKPHRLLMASGRLMDPAKPEDDDFDIQDIAHALSMTTIFGSGAIGYYSHAQHAVYRSHMVEKEFAKAALIMSAWEGYWKFPFIPGDIEPDKDEATMDCQPLANHIALAFGLAIDAFDEPYINLVDDRLHTLAAGVMLSNPHPFWEANGGVPDGSIFDIDKKFQCWTWQEGKKAFLARYMHLRNKAN